MSEPVLHLEHGGRVNDQHGQRIGTLTAVTTDRPTGVVLQIELNEDGMHILKRDGFMGLSLSATIALDRLRKQ